MEREREMMMVMIWKTFHDCNFPMFVYDIGMMRMKNEYEKSPQELWTTRERMIDARLVNPLLRMTVAADRGWMGWGY